MNHHIDIQRVCEDIIPIDDEIMTHWAGLALSGYGESAELTIRLVSAEEMTELNHQYRGQNKTTNVLAFPSNIPKHVALDYPFLGDVIICPSVLLQESTELNKPLIAHWAHITIHGILHLLGYDHIEEKDSIVMQSLEIKLLYTLNFDNPYHTEEHPFE